MFEKKTVLLWLCVAVLFVSQSVLAQAPETFVQSVTHEGHTITLQMVKNSVRGPHFEVLVQNAQGNYDTWVPGEARTYIGTVAERPDAYAAGILLADGTLYTRVNFDRGVSWWTEGGSVFGVHPRNSTVFGTHPPGPGPVAYAIPTLQNVTPGKAGLDTYRFGVGIDTDYRYYAKLGSVADCLEMIEFSAISVRAQYLHNVMLKPELGRVIIRPHQSHCLYEDVSGNDKLYAFRNYWNANHPYSDAPRDVAALATGDLGGGVAWVNVIGGVSGYSRNGTRSDGSFDGIWRHELGHNWGARDHHAGRPEGGTIMCGNGYARFNGPAVQTILNERDRKIDRFTNIGTYDTVNLPPYAAMDFVDAVATGEAVIIDVMANDFDVNGQALSLWDFEFDSNQGGTVTLSAGTGPDGRDELIYTAPTDISDNVDHFHYTIEDSGGARSTGVVIVSLLTEITIDVQPEDQIGLFPGDSVEFSISASDLTDDPMNYTWYFSKDEDLDPASDTLLSGPVTDGDTLTVSLAADMATAVFGQQGYYYCVVDNGNHTQMSEAAYLQINHLIAYYAFAGNAHDSSIYGYDGVWANPAQESYNTTDPAVGSASAVFTGDSDSYINLGTDFAQDPQMADNYAQGSMSFWFKTTSTAQMAVMGTMNDNVTSALTVTVNHGGNAGRVALYLRSEGGTGNILNLQTAANSALVDGQWHHVAIVWAEGNAVAYIDGVVVSWSNDVVRGSPVLADWQYPMFFGARNNRGTVDQHFDGGLDELKMFNYRLTESQVLQEYAAGEADWVCVNRPRFDLTGNCTVGLADFAILAANWLECGRSPDIYCP